MISEPLNFPTLLSFNSIKTFKTKLNGIQWHSSNTVHFKQITFKTEMKHIFRFVNYEIIQTIRFSTVIFTYAT